MVKEPVFKAVGPLICALVLVGILLFSPLNNPRHYSKEDLDTFANSNSTEVYVGEDIKQQFFAHSEYLPIFGSSELNRFDPFHPAVLADKYNRNYRPFLIGRRGTQSLAHYFYLEDVNKGLKNRKFVFIISPQWFGKRVQKGKITADGMSPQAFSEFVTREKLYYWINTVDPMNKTTKIMAKRLLTFELVRKDPVLNKYLKKLAKGKTISKNLKTISHLQFFLLRSEDSFFQAITPKKIYSEDLKKFEKILPDKYNNAILQQLAKKNGKRQSTNNPFLVDDHWYTSHNIERRLKELQGSQKDFNFLHGIEYHDFQLLLNKFAEHKMDVLFIIQPLNYRWISYTGMNKTMLKNFAIKISTQLKSQGFSRVVNFLERGREAYFLKDSIHFGNRGWVALDSEINKFVNEPNVTDYHLNNDKFLANEWLSADE